MTAPQQPGLVIDAPAPVTIGTREEADAIAAALPPRPIPGQPGAVPVNPLDARRDAIAAATAQADAESAKLERENPWYRTAAMQAERGFLDLMLSPGAIIGAATEGLGSVLDDKSLSEFGREYGQAMSGRRALAWGATLWGDNADQKRSNYSDKLRELDAEEEAWPMLSTVSHAAGMLAGGGVVGAFAGGGSLAANMTVGGVEGAAGGAQMAYEHNAPLRDVLSATLVGGALGAGLTGAVDVAGHAIARRAARSAELRSSFAAPEAAPEAVLTVEQAGGIETHEVVTDLLKARSAVEKATAGLNPAAYGAAEKSAAAEALGKLVKKAEGFQAENWSAKEPGVWQRIFHRTEILDAASRDVAEAADAVAKLRPQMDFAIDQGRLARLVAKETAPEAIGGVQQGVQQALRELPRSVEGASLGRILRKAGAALEKVDAPGAMVKGHEVVGQLLKAANTASDDVTKAFATRTARDMSDRLSSAAFGKAGELYQAVSKLPSQGIEAMANQTMVRDGLRRLSVRGNLPLIAKDEAMSLAKAYDALATLSGGKRPEQFIATVRKLEQLTSKAEGAVTLDGGSIARVLDKFQGKAGDKASQALGTLIGGSIGGVPGAMAGHVVADAIRPGLAKVLGAARATLGGAGRMTVRGSRSLSEHAEELVPSGLHLAGHIGEHSAREVGVERVLSMDEIHSKVENLSRMAANPGASEAVEHMTGPATKMIDQKVGPGMGAAVANDATTKVANLLRDIPKPVPSIRGKKFEQLSESDRKKATAMITATTDPMSIFDDFARGAVNYDKVQYVWQQYPGLKTAAQAGLIDILQTQMSADERAAISGTTLSRLDLFFDMGGTVSPTVAPDFALRMSQIGAAQAQQQKPPQGRPLKLPGSQPTFTERLGRRHA